MHPDVLEQLVLQVLLVSPAQMVLLVPLVQSALSDPADRLVPKVLKVLMVNLEKALLDYLVTPVCLAHQVKMDSMVFLVPREKLVHLVVLEHLVSTEILEFEESQEQQDPQDQPVHLDLVDLQA